MAQPYDPFAVTGPDPNNPPPPPDDDPRRKRDTFAPSGGASSLPSQPQHGQASGGNIPSMSPDSRGPSNGVTPDQPSPAVTSRHTELYQPNLQPIPQLSGLAMATQHGIGGPLVRMLGANEVAKRDAIVAANAQEQRKYENSIEAVRLEHQRNSQFTPVDTDDGQGHAVRKYVDPSQFGPDSAGIPLYKGQGRSSIRPVVDADGKRRYHIFNPTTNEDTATDAEAPEPGHGKPMIEQAWEKTRDEIVNGNGKTPGRNITAQDFIDFNRNWAGSSAQGKQDVKPDPGPRPSRFSQAERVIDGQKVYGSYDATTGKFTPDNTPGLTGASKVGTDSGKAAPNANDQIRAAANKAILSHMEKGDLNDQTLQKINNGKGAAAIAMRAGGTPTGPAASAPAAAPPPAAAPAAPAQYSHVTKDGKFGWNGKTWVPLKQ